ncbi:hypothetical protein GCM10010446_06680 [Streptomyces enissocaesilis]|uniref:Uncharacterized protein n=1 Tax=Streptomyces enissocaesilis TaxID=332589 RepID=A0ABN3WTJ8_9ACTN
MIFTRDDRAGGGKLSFRLGLVTAAAEATEDVELYGYLVDHLSRGGKAGVVPATDRGRRHQDRR